MLRVFVWTTKSRRFGKPAKRGKRRFRDQHNWRRFRGHRDWRRVTIIRFRFRQLITWHNHHFCTVLCAISLFRNLTHVDIIYWFYYALLLICGLNLTQQLLTLFTTERVRVAISYSSRIFWLKYDTSGAVWTASPKTFISVGFFRFKVVFSVKSRFSKIVRIQIN